MKRHKNNPFSEMKGNFTIIITITITIKFDVFKPCFMEWIFGQLCQSS
jgi:hypothetical protein